MGSKFIGSLYNVLYAEVNCHFIYFVEKERLEDMKERLDKREHNLREHQQKFDNSRRRYENNQQQFSQRRYVKAQ